ncbi:MAG: hypothetical protein RQM95_02845 [Syntrophaceticus schinkii]
MKRESDGTFRFKKGLGWLKNELGVSTEVLVNLQKSMNEINKQIKKGELESDDDLNVWQARQGISDVVLDVVQASSTHPGGINKKEYRWWGYFIWVSHDTIRLAKLIYGVGGGVSILIPGAGTFVAAFAISYALVDYYDRGCGVIFRYLYVPAVLTGMYTQCYYLSSCTVFD